MIFSQVSAKRFLVTVDDTKRVFAAAPQPKQLWLVEGAQHIDLHAYNTETYQKRIGAFLAAALRK